MGLLSVFQTKKQSQIRTHVDELNQMILQGDILNAFDKFYADDVVMIDAGQEPREGKATNRAFEEAFVSGLTEFRGAEVKGLAIDEDRGRAYVEWHFDFSHKDWGDQQYDQVAVQDWKNGQIVRERFFKL